MKKIMAYVILGFLSMNTLAAQWLALTPADIKNIQIVQAGNSNGSPEGLYIALNADIVGDAASYCSKKNFVAISDPKLIDRAYSGLLYALSTQKTVQLYVDGAGQCLSNVPLVTMFMLRAQ